MYMIKIEQLDKSMKQLTLNLMEYQEDDPKYQQIAKQLNEDYEIFNIFLNLQGINNPYYYIKYSNLHDIERILRNAGYIKESKKISNSLIKIYNKQSIKDIYVRKRLFTVIKGTSPIKKSCLRF